MSTTSVHFPAGLLERLKRAAKDRRVTRNRFIVEACEVALSRESTSWPKGLFDRKGTEELRKSFPSWTRSMYEARRARRKAPF